MSTIRNLRRVPCCFVISSSRCADLTGSVYGRRMYEVMRIWDEDLPEWDPEERDFAAAWRKPTEVGRVALAEVGRSQRHASLTATSRRPYAG